MDSDGPSLQYIYNTALSRLKALHLEIDHGLQVPSRTKRNEEGESSSAFSVWSKCTLSTGTSSR